MERDEDETARRRRTPLKQRTRSRPFPTALAIDDIAVKQGLVDAVSAIACNVSRMLRRASLFCSHYFHSALESDTPLPSKAALKNVTFWRQLLLLGCREENGKEATHDDARIQQSWTALREKFPPVDRRKHDGQVITHAAKTFKTAFFNNLWMPFFGRVAKVAKAKFPKEEKVGFRVCVAVETGAPVEGLSSAAAAFASELRSALGAQARTIVTNSFIAAHPVEALRVTHQLQCAMRAANVKGARLTPIFKVRRAHVLLDADSLIPLLRNAGVFNVNEKRTLDEMGARVMNETDYSVRQAIVASYFNVPRPARGPDAAGNRNVWTLALTTDGATAHFACVAAADWSRYVSDKIEVTRKKMDGKKRAADARAASDSDSEAEEPEKKPTPKKKPVTAAAASRPLFPKDAVTVTVDPGRSNIAYVAISGSAVDGAMERSFTRLTARQYYTDSGIRKAKKKKEGWLGESMMEAFRRMADRTNTRSGSSADIVAYIDEFNAVSGEWWGEVLKARHARLDAATAIAKRRVQDRFCSQTRRTAVARFGPHRRIVAVYGAAKFRPSGIGNLTVPTTGMFKAFRRAYPDVQLQDEFCTTKRCSCCHELQNKTHRQVAVHAVIDEERGAVALELDPRAVVVGGSRRSTYEDIRGLLFCPKCSKFRSRDEGASINIDYVWRAIHIEGLSTPEPFCRAAAARKRAADKAARVARKSKKQPD